MGSNNNYEDVEIARSPVFTNLYELSEDEKKDILEQQKQRHKASIDYMGLLWPKMLDEYKKYRSIADAITDELGQQVDGRANLFIPYPWAIVESTMPRLAGKLPKVHAFPRKPGDRKKAQNIQDLLVYTLDRMQFLKLQPLWIRQYEIYGWSPLFYYWRQEKREVLEREVSDEMGIEKVQRLKKVTKTVWDDFYARVIDVWDSYLQPGVETIEDGDWFQFREYMSKKDIKSRVKGGIFYPDVLKYVEDNPNPASDVWTDGAGRNERDSLIAQRQNATDHSYGRYEVIYTLEDDKIIAMIDGQVLARVGDNPNPLQKKPIINLNLMPMMGEPIGIGTIEALGGLPDKLNALSNARLDNISLLVNKVIIADRLANTDFQNLHMTAGNVILTDNMKSIDTLKVDDIGMSSEREIMTTKEEMQFAVGISDYIVGMSGNARLSSTATGVSTIVREANARFNMKLATMEAYPLRTLILAAYAYLSVYMADDKLIHILGPEGYVTREVTIDDVLCDCDLIIEPGSSAPVDQQSRREGLMQLLDRVIAAPQVVDQSKFFLEVFEAFDVRNPSQYLLQKEKMDANDDRKLALAENVAIGQGQEIELKGNDDVHVTIHAEALQSGETDGWNAEAKAQLSEHLKAHLERKSQQMASVMQMSQNSMFGGTNGQSGDGTTQAGGGNTLFNPTQSGGAPTGPISGVGGTTGVSGPGGNVAG